MISFWPFPMPVETPLGQGYILYSTPQPMWENDTHLVALDDGRLLHFSTNQLRGVANGTYGIQPTKPLEKQEVPRHLRQGWTESILGKPLGMPLCGAPGENHPPLLTSETEGVTCLACLRLRLLDVEGMLFKSAPVTENVAMPPTYGGKCVGCRRSPKRCLCPPVASDAAGFPLKPKRPRPTSK